MTSPPETLPAGGAAAVPVADAAAAEAVLAASVAVAVGVLDIVELTTPAGTSAGFSVPQTGQFCEPGLSLRHCSKVAMQMELGTEPM